MSAPRPRDPLATALRACLRAFAFVAAFGAAINLLFLTIPLYMMQIFDRVVASRSFDTLLFLTLMAFAGVSLLAFLDYQRTRFGDWPWKNEAPVHARDEGRFAKHADGRIEKIEG